MQISKSKEVEDVGLMEENINKIGEDMVVLKFKDSNMRQ